MIKDLINTATGLELSQEELILSGERSWNLKRCINIRMGLNKANDKLPQAFLKPLPDGGSAGYTIPFDEMLDAYYSAREWDKLTGIPNRDKLEKLGLKELVKEFYFTNPDD